MPLWWLVLPLLVYVGAGALAAFVFGAVMLVHRVRFGPPPPQVIVLPESTAADPEESTGEIALTEALVVPADAS